MRHNTIERLITESGFIRFTSEENPKTPIDWSCDYTRELERFAELIVRECAEVAGCNGHVSGFSLGDLFKQHFGVEE